jgi:hypothetical protein
VHEGVLEVEKGWMGDWVHWNGGGWVAAARRWESDFAGDGIRPYVCMAEGIIGEWMWEVFFVGAGGCELM